MMSRPFARVDRRTSEARKYFFFEKKKQKTFALLVDASHTIDTYRNK